MTTESPSTVSTAGGAGGHPPATPGTALELRALSRRFGSAPPVVRAVDLRVAAGEFFSLIGPSGCGKTTTLRMIAGLEEASAGSIHVHGQDVTELPAHRRPVHTVFQHYALFPHLTVAENVGFGLKERREPKDAVRHKVARLLDLVGLTGREGARPRELSGGMQQRVALARALVLDPRVLLLDEPLGALDLRLRRQMQLLLKTVQREIGITFVYVTHDQEEAFSMSDRVGIMSAGELVQVAAPRAVYERPATRFVAHFVGASNQLPGTVVVASEAGYEVDLTGVGRATVPGVPGLAAGMATMVVLRPEAALLDASPGGPSGLRVDGSVTDVSFRGPQTSVTVRAGELELVVVAPSQNVAADLAVSSPAGVSFAAADLWAIHP